MIQEAVITQVIIKVIKYKGWEILFTQINRFHYFHLHICFNKEINHESKLALKKNIISHVDQNLYVLEG